jgi:hypothetical protein
LASATALACGSRSTGSGITASSSEPPGSNGCCLRLEVDGVGHHCLLLRAARQQRLLPGEGGRIERGPHRPHARNDRRAPAGALVIVIGVRRSTLPASARAHRGSGAARWLGCAPDLAGPGRSLLRPQAVPASGEPRPTQSSCTSGSGKAVVSDPWTVPPHRKLGQPDWSCSGSRGGCRWRRFPRRLATRAVVASPRASTRLALPRPSAASVGSCGAQRAARPP